MSRPLTVAICQLRWSPDPGRNLDQGLAMKAHLFDGEKNVFARATPAFRW
jgi:hypothetical protein